MTPNPPRTLGPLRRSPKPKHNAPAFFGTIAAGVSLLLTATADVPGWARGTIAVVAVAGGVYSQVFGRARD